MTTRPVLNRTLRGAIAAAAWLLAASTLHAADTPSDPVTASVAADRLAKARTLIADERWAAAIAELQRVNDTRSADWNNLMGYSHRKARKPDHAAAERYYNEALRIDPQHRGALAYSGELYLALGDLDKAEGRLTALARACAEPCAEQAALRQAIAAFKANGRPSAGTAAP